MPVNSIPGFFCLNRLRNWPGPRGVGRAPRPKPIETWLRRKRRSILEQRSAKTWWWASLTFSSFCDARKTAPSNSRRKTQTRRSCWRSRDKLGQVKQLWKRINNRLCHHNHALLYTIQSLKRGSNTWKGERLTHRRKQRPSSKKRRRPLWKSRRRVMKQGSKKSQIRLVVDKSVQLRVDLVEMTKCYW